MGQIIPVTLANIITGRRLARGGGNGVGGTGSVRGTYGGRGGTSLELKKCWRPWGDARVWVCYDMHLPALSLQDGENTRTILAGIVLPALHGHVLCKNCHRCGVSREDLDPKICTSLSPICCDCHLKAAQNSLGGLT